MAMPLHAEKQQPNEPERCACSGGCVTDTTSIQDVPPVAVSNASGHSSVFRIPAMDCPNEENDIRKALLVSREFGRYASNWLPGP
jgi:Cd2+/Zn2+-exporting ATPase